MPEQEHPILARARETEQIADDLLTFWNPVERYLGPHENDDWPRELSRKELDVLIPRLRGAIGTLASTIEAIAENSAAEPEKAQRVIEGVRQIEQAELAIRAGEPLFGTPAGQDGQEVTRTQQALVGQNFPLGAPSAACLGAGHYDASHLGKGIPDRQHPAATPRTAGWPGRLP